MKRWLLALGSLLAACDADAPVDELAEDPALLELRAREVGRRLEGAVPDPNDPEVGFALAPGTVLEGPRPTRFRGPLPVDLADFESGSTAFPPWTFVEARLCHGDDVVWQRYLDALESSLSRGAYTDPVPEYFGNLLAHCRGPDFCRWIRNTVSGGGRAEIRDLVASRLPSCVDPQTRAVVEQADLAFDALAFDVVLRWYANADERRGPIPPRLFQAITAMLDAQRTDWYFGAMESIAQRDDLRVRQLFESMRAGLMDIDRGALALLLAGRDEPWAKAAVRKACKQQDLAGEPACLARVVISERDPLFMVGVVEFDRLVEARGEAEATHRLHACVEAAEVLPIEQRVNCLRRLARVDWTLAASLADRADLDNPDRLPETLRRFDSATDLQTTLRNWELLPAQPDPDRVDPFAIAVPSVLARYGRLHWYPAGLWNDVGAFEWALYDMSARVPGLRDAVFEVVWKLTELDQPGELRVAAHLQGRRYLFDVEPLEDLDAGHAIAAILNAICSDLDDPMRFQLLEASQRGVGFVMGPAEGLAALHREGLL